MRRAVYRHSISPRGPARVFELDRSAMSKMIEFPELRGRRLLAPPARSWIDAQAEFIGQVLSLDCDAPKNQRQTLSRTVERLREERGSVSGHRQWVAQILDDARCKHRQMFEALRIVSPLQRQVWSPRCPAGMFICARGGRARSIESDDLVIHAADPGLSLLHHLQLETAAG